jgi:DNA polymerase-1
MAAACCAPRLEAEIAEAETVIAAGAEAVQALLGGGSIARLRGYPHYRDLEQVHGSEQFAGKQQKIVVTTNPVMVIRDDANFPTMVRDFRLAINPLPQPSLPKVKWTEDIEQAKAWATEMIEQFELRTGSFYDDSENLVACDIEARGTDEESGLSQFAEVVCAGFSIRTDRAVVFGEAPCYDDEFRNDYLRRLYEVPEVRYLWHNGKYDVKILRQQGIHARVDEDTMLLSYALDERPGNPESGAGGHSLEWLLKDELGWPKYEPDSVRDFKKTGILSDKRARIDLYEYNGMDTAGALGLFVPFKLQATNDKVFESPYRSTLIPLSEAFTQVEMQGNKFDSEEACDLLEDQAYPKLRQQRQYMRQLSEREKLNPNSPTQLVDLLYDEWGFSHTLRRGQIEVKGKRSTDKWVRAEVLETGNFKVTGVDRTKMVDFVQHLQDFKTLGNWKGATEGYVLRRSKDGRLYTDFKIHGTESGRVSSSNPNLQNVTRPKEGLPNIRSCFLADDGCTLISGDLSQAELRAISYLSGDTGMQAIYTDTGRSLHKEIATEFYGSEYSYEQYVRAKNINFGVVYWQSAFTFAQMYKMPQEEAQNFIDFWWERFPKVYEWTKNIEWLVLNEGELQSPFGHKRRFYVIPSDQSGRIHVVKEGINFLPQNIAANITLYAMADLVDRLDPAVAQVRLTVHDNIVVNCRTNYVEEVAPIVKATMESAAKESIGWDFPFGAEISVGQNWGDMEDWNGN